MHFRQAMQRNLEWKLLSRRWERIQTIALAIRTFFSFPGHHHPLLPPSWLLPPTTVFRHLCSIVSDLSCWEKLFVCCVRDCFWGSSDLCVRSNARLDCDSVPQQFYLHGLRGRSASLRRSQSNAELFTTVAKNIINLTSSRFRLPITLSSGWTHFTTIISLYKTHYSITRELHVHHKALSLNYWSWGLRTIINRRTVGKLSSKWGGLSCHRWLPSRGNVRSQKCCSE